MKELMKLIGTTALLREGEFLFPVVIEDVKNSYGVSRLEVSPVGGSGSAWVNLDRVKVSA
jgi:hypothetical protein